MLKMHPSKIKNITIIITSKIKTSHTICFGANNTINKKNIGVLE
jgi:hypothetical protein